MEQDDTQPPESLSAQQRALLADPVARDRLRAFVRQQQEALRVRPLDFAGDDEGSP